MLITSLIGIAIAFVLSGGGTLKDNIETEEIYASTLPDLQKRYETYYKPVGWTIKHTTTVKWIKEFEDGFFMLTIQRRAN